MRGFLKSREGIFQLALSTTTIGREGCDLFLSGDCANCIHAVIKYNASDASFTLHDINSVLGVYVNDCRVHNSAVMLEHNDIIRFGYTGIAYEFLLECQPKLRDYQGSEYTQQTPVETTVGDGAGWVAGIRKDTADYNEENEASLEDNYENVKSELGCLRREVERMSELEGECVLKDDLIDQLREEVTNLQNFVRHIEVDRCPMCQRNATGNTATGPVSSIQQTTGTTQTGCVDATNFMRAVVEGGQQTATIELVCQMHRDMSMKDETIARLAKELEAAKKDLLQKECHISALESYLNQLPAPPEAEQYIAKDREVNLLRYKQKLLDGRKQELSSQVGSLTDELNKLKVALDTEIMTARRAQSEVEALKLKNQDLERVERLARVDLEQLSKRLEKIRSRAVQTALAGAGTKTPDKLISDDELVMLLKKCADDRADLLKKVAEDSQQTDKKVSESTSKKK